MKRIESVLFIFLFLLIGKINAQQVKINIVTTGYRGDVGVFDPAVNYNPKNFISIIHLDKNGAGVYTADLSKPRYLYLGFMLPGSIYRRYTLYISPGDDLLFKINFTNTAPTISVSGKGSINNQPEIFALTNIDLYKFKHDKLPDRVISVIKNQEARNDVILKQYIKRYKPSVALIKNMRLNVQYFALNSYYEFYHNTHLPFKTSSYDREWQSVEDSLMIKHKLNNDYALMSYNYEDLIDFFLIQGCTVLINQEIRQPIVFYRDWYHTTVEIGRKIYTGEGRNLFIERVINRYFTGNTREFAYARMLRFHLHFKHYEGLDLVFAHFKQKYPASSYIPIFDNAIAEIVAKQKQVLNNKIVFAADNGTKLNTIADVTSLMRGKTVFVDMWGTWCSPCRAELEKFTPQIRDHFKDKNITFLYIANKDISHPEEWKKVIAYYKIEGTHILANKNLDKDIMTKIKSTGYPTHFIIKKDGSFKKIKTQDESNTQQVIKEIEAEL